jgi:23S rRNA (cytidine1920-2'-O)/16S rRNA (cytidine1409-2'-O)-methyltransferase
MEYVSRAGKKLEHALSQFQLNVNGLVCADFGSSTGGFVDCLLQHGASKVFAVERGYGALDWKLRNDERVVVMERTNAMHVNLPTKVDLVTIDTSWTKLEKVVPNAKSNLKDNGRIIALIKPHYEAHPKLLYKGKLKEEHISAVLEAVRKRLLPLGLEILQEIESPITGGKAKNKEFLILLKKVLAF